MKRTAHISPTVHFPYDYLIAIGIGLLAFIWAVHSSFETDELRELHASLSEGRRIPPEPEMEATRRPLHGAGDEAGA
ncbi:MAG: hypothetical protein ACRDWE_01155 [Acidimicrobiales bacterium]